MAQAAATSFTFTSSSDVSQTKDGITVTLSKGAGSNDPFFSDGGEMRLYARNTITVTGASVTDISLTFAKQGTKEYATLTTSTGTLTTGGVSTSNTDNRTDTWSGDVASVTFTLGASGQRIIREITVVGNGADPSVPTDPDEPDIPDTLDPEWSYDEPTVVYVPEAMTVQGDAYTFVDNNIQVSCTKGAVNDSYFSVHAGYEMTFTATRNIKGLVINGFVKKDFECTTNRGEAEYLTPYVDLEADPVVVVRDIDANSVTLSCVKQLRCYSVEVYFDSNPDVEIGGGTDGGDFVFDTADAVYESEWSSFVGQENYSLFLYDAERPYYPYIALDLYPAGEGLTGTYTMSDGTLGDYSYYVWGENESEMAWAFDGEAVISVSGDTCSVTGSIFCENGATYSFSFTGNLNVYLDSEYYGDDSGDDGEQDGVADPNVEIRQTLDPSAPMYDLQGRRITGTPRGIVLQNGSKYILR